MTVRSLGATVGLLALLSAAAEAETILDCTFDSKEVDQSIGEGGAAAGEPVSLGGVPATVRSQPFPTPCLEMTEDWGFGARAVRFEFLNGSEVQDSGVTFDFSLYFQDFNGFSVYVRERSFSAVSFLNLTFTSDGSILFQDLNDPENRVIGTYTTGEILPFVLTFTITWAGGGNFRAKVSVSIGGEAVIVDENLGIIPVGVGAVLFGLDHDEDSEGTFFLDGLRATTFGTPVLPTTWGSVKAGPR